MPARCRLRGEQLTLSVVGLADNVEIEQALTAGVASAKPGAQLHLLWDARRSVTLLSAADVAFRMGLVASLAERGIVARCAVLGDGAHQQAIIDLLRKEMPKALPQLPVRVFVDQTEALEWLAGSEG
jgi:SpoIIAA-like